MPRTRDNYDKNLTVRIGKNLRIYRKIAGLSGGAVAKSIGISAQQLQKYETGENRISAEFIYHVAKTLNVRVECFFEELEVRAHARAKSGKINEANTQAHKALTLMTAYSRITDRDVRNQIYTLVQSLSTKED